MAERQIVAIGGGKFCAGLARFLVEATAKERPRALYIGTAMAEDKIERLKAIRSGNLEKRG